MDTHDRFEATIRGLEAGLRVSQVATFELQTCAEDDEASKVLVSPRLKDFDAIPVVHGDRIVGVLERDRPPNGSTAGSCMLPLSRVRLTSAEAPLLRFLTARGEEGYTLVVDESGVCGIITRSDLLKLPVRLLVFAFITHLELVMRETIEAAFPGDEKGWRALLKKNRLEKLDEKMGKLRTSRMDPDPLELTEFCDKREILARRYRLGRQFCRNLRALEDLRNAVSHAGMFLADDAEAGHLSKRLETAKLWIRRLRSLGANGSMEKTRLRCKTGKDGDGLYPNSIDAGDLAAAGIVVHDRIIGTVDGRRIGGKIGLANGSYWLATRGTRWTRAANSNVLQSLGYKPKDRFVLTVETHTPHPEGSGTHARTKKTSPMKVSLQPDVPEVEPLASRPEKRIGFDTSSLNRFGEDSRSSSVCASLTEAEVAPVLSSLSIIEILKWGDDRSRDRLLDSVAKLRRVADYRLLPLPHEVVEAWFLAWLTGPTNLVLGGERTAGEMQDILERAAARDPSWRQAAERFAAEEQRFFRERLKQLRVAAGQVTGPQPRSAAGFIEGLLGDRNGMARVINASFPPSLHGQAPLTSDEAAECIKRVPALRADLVTLGLATYRHAVQGLSTRKGAAGAIDIAQAAYLPLTDIFVVDDGGMLAHLRDVVEIAVLPTRVVPYAELLPTLRSTRTAGDGAKNAR